MWTIELHLKWPLARTVATADGLLWVSRAISGRLAVLRLWSSGHKRPVPCGVATLPLTTSSGRRVLRFHVDLPSNGWLHQGQIGEAQPRGHQGTENFKEKTLFINILEFFFQRHFWDVAFTYFLNLTSKRLLESTVLNLSSSESSLLIDALALFTLWYLILYSVTWANFGYFTFCLEFESSIPWIETQRNTQGHPESR